MPNEWKELTELTRGKAISVERVRVLESNIAIEARRVPALAQLPMDDQVFIGAFVRRHGSIKDMERLFGVSYPTIKNRLNRLSQALGLGMGILDEPAAPNRSIEILYCLERGEHHPPTGDRRDGDIEELRSPALVRLDYWACRFWCPVLSFLAADVAALRAHQLRWRDRGGPDVQVPDLPKIGPISLRPLRADSALHVARRLMSTQSDRRISITLL